ncbi:lasso peptide biosynthesis B2 protein [Amycolatopsis cynarae]|uniref:lasso peptide biosynthesis B2 protein n=1 Tax=Amycolatopsis cynarae TaxID=2995223 RepID=UPI003898FF06
MSVICDGDGCLPHSIATAALCRVRGALPSWLVGVQLDPFRAHAWVEVDGTAIGEDDDMARWTRLIVVHPSS